MFCVVNDVYFELFPLALLFRGRKANNAPSRQLHGPFDTKAPPAFPASGTASSAPKFRLLEAPCVFPQ